MPDADDPTTRPATADDLLRSARSARSLHEAICIDSDLPPCDCLDRADRLEALADQMEQGEWTEIAEAYPGQPAIRCVRAFVINETA